MYKPISKICLSISLSTTMLIIIIAFFVGGIAFIQNAMQLHTSEQKRLNMIASTVISAISGELIIGESRAVTAIKKEFKKNIT